MVLPETQDPRPETPDSRRGTLRVAVIQFHRERGKPEDNLRRMNTLLPEITDADIVLMPEAWNGPQPISQAELGDLLAAWGDIAAKQHYTLLTGGLFVQIGDGKVSDVCHVIGPDGALLGQTEKIFPSAPVGERKYMVHGRHLPVYEAGGVRFGVVICVDVFYPELVRSLALRGAEVVFNPANIVHSRLPLWHRLIQVRAAENTIFTVFCTNTGTTYPDDRRVLGHSAASAPYGELCFEAGPAPGVYRIELDMTVPARLRARWPYLSDIRSIADCGSETVRFNENE